jgi:predicted nicotinamide N-methyase
MEPRPQPLMPGTLPSGAASDVVEETYRFAGRTVRIVRPRDHDAILDELLAEDDPDEDRLPFWAVLWPSGVALAQAIGSQPLPGRRVLELGCGLGLASVAAAAAGATVLAVDRSPEATTFAAVNAARNGLTLDTAVASFDEPQQLLRDAPWDLVLAADVLYEQRNVPVLLSLMPRLVDKGGEVWLGDPGRPMLGAFLEGADTTGWRRERVPTDIDTVAVYRLRLSA